MYVQQNPVLLTPTVKAELMLSSSLFPEHQPSGKAYADLFHLQDVIEQAASELSGGEQQRVMLARQLSFSPSLLLLDECTSNLGWLHAQTIEKELVRLRNGGVCVVMATHNIPQAHRLADNILVLRDGVVVDDGDPFAVSLLKGEWIQ